MGQCQAGESAKNYRLGLDLGSNSIGWCAVTLDADGRPAGVLDAGVRILTPNDEAGRDPQSKSSLTASRRDARSMRTRRARFVRRRERLVETLAKAGLLPSDRAQRDKLMADMDPYWLRRAALEQPLEPYEIGRAIFHLNQRRGFKSNRIADSGDKEKSAMKKGVKALEGKLKKNSARTLGEMLAGMHGRDKQGKPANDGAPPQPVRFRPESQGNKNNWNFYPTREMIEEEIDKIWEKQREYHAELLTRQLRDRVKRIVIEQRPLKKPPVGRCTLMPDAGTISRFGFEIDMGERAPKAHPLFQRFRILQDVCQLRVRCQPGRPERFLTLRERDAIAAMLMNPVEPAQEAVDFATLRREAGLPPDARFNYESAGRNGFQTDHTAAKLALPEAFGPKWRSLRGERQVEIVERLLAQKDEGALCRWLQEECGLTEAAAEFVSAMRLPQGHGHLGRAALEELVPVMEQESLEETDKETGEIYRRPLTYDKAVKRLGLHHSAHGPGERRPRLPYYGEAVPGSYVISRPNAPQGSQEFIGRVSNPTVHIGLNQLRKIVNALIDAYGPPREIVVELARELKLNKKQKEARERENRKNKERNDEIRKEFDAFADTRENRLRLRLYGELPAGERVCVYSGGCISKGMLFGGEVEIDHILPYSRTLDDSFMNKALCIREDNRWKGNRAPAEYWTGDERQEIAERAERLFKRKAWRFAPDAMQRFDEKNEGWLARQLNDTAYLSRMAKHYLEHVCGQVWVSPGRLTKMLRGRWGLNKLLADNGASGAGQEKNRNDHRHHAVDAFVIACTDRGLLKRIAQESGRAEELRLDRLFPKDSFPQPFDDYYRRMTDCLQQLVVSHKPDHGIPPGGRDNPHATSGALLEGTAYGPVKKEISGKRYNLVYRKRVDELSRSEIERVADCRLRNDLKELKETLAEFGKRRNIRRVRILKTKEPFRIVRHGADGEFKKAYVSAGNHRIEIYEMPDGKWAGEGVTVYDANRPGFAPNWRNGHPEASLVMRVHKGDLIEADFGEGSAIYKVCRLDAKSSRLKLAKHYEGGSLDKRHEEKNDPFRYEMKAYSVLKAANARRVVVSPIGRVRAREGSALIGRVVEVAEAGRHLCKFRGFLTVTVEGGRGRPSAAR